MGTPSPHRYLWRERGFTILESFIVLILLTVISLLILALIKHNVEPEIPARLQSPQTESSVSSPLDE